MKTVSSGEHTAKHPRESREGDEMVKQCPPLSTLLSIRERREKR